MPAAQRRPAGHCRPPACPAQWRASRAPQSAPLRQASSAASGPRHPATPPPRCPACLSSRRTARRRHPWAAGRRRRWRPGGRPRRQPLSSRRHVQALRRRWTPSRRHITGVAHGARDKPLEQRDYCDEPGTWQGLLRAHKLRAHKLLCYVVQSPPLQMHPCNAGCSACRRQLPSTPACVGLPLLQEAAPSCTAAPMRCTPTPCQWQQETATSKVVWQAAATGQAVYQAAATGQAVYQAAAAGQSCQAAPGQAQGPAPQRDGERGAVRCAAAAAAAAGCSCLAPAPPPQEASATTGGQPSWGAMLLLTVKRCSEPQLGTPHTSAPHSACAWTAHCTFASYWPLPGRQLS
jgi:hypothetical protein